MPHRQQQQAGRRLEILVHHPHGVPLLGARLIPSVLWKTVVEWHKTFAHNPGCAVSQIGHFLRQWLFLVGLTRGDFPHPGCYHWRRPGYRWFAGGDLQMMQNWLGTELYYQLQGEGDLGKRMENSFLSAFDKGAQEVITIGIDCPGVNAPVLAEAFGKIRNYDLLLGPAVDGGYYLIGLKRAIGQLFINIDWGTAKVLQQTVDIAQQLNLSVGYLATLADVDRPEDLPNWDHS